LQCFVGAGLFSFEENRTKSFKDFGGFREYGALATIYAVEITIRSFEMLCRFLWCFIEA